MQLHGIPLRPLPSTNFPPPEWRSTAGAALLHSQSDQHCSPLLCIHTNPALFNNRLFFFLRLRGTFRDNAKKKKAPFPESCVLPGALTSALTGAILLATLQTSSCPGLCLLVRTHSCPTGLVYCPTDGPSRAHCALGCSSPQRPQVWNGVGRARKRLP